jgi:hypothetical protein
MNGNGRPPKHPGFEVVDSKPTSRIEFTPTPGLLARLEQLVATGLFGRSVHEAAERLVERGIEDSILTQTIDRFPS